MSALEKIFDGYYADRLGGIEADSEEMTKWDEETIQALKDNGLTGREIDRVMELVSLYGGEAEKMGFMAGFRMAWELLKNMSEGKDTEKGTR